VLNPQTARVCGVKTAYGIFAIYMQDPEASTIAPGSPETASVTRDHVVNCELRTPPTLTVGFTVSSHRFGNRFVFVDCRDCQMTVLRKGSCGLRFSAIGKHY
jgi:hypothetical protein